MTVYYDIRLESNLNVFLCFFVLIDMHNQC